MRCSSDYIIKTVLLAIKLNFIQGVTCFSNCSWNLKYLFSGKEVFSFLCCFTPKAFSTRHGWTFFSLCLAVSVSGLSQGSCDMWRFSPLFGAYCVLHPLPAALCWWCCLLVALGVVSAPS